MAKITIINSDIDGQHIEHTVVKDNVYYDLSKQKPEQTEDAEFEEVELSALRMNMTVEQYKQWEGREISAGVEAFKEVFKPTPPPHTSE